MSILLKIATISGMKTEFQAEAKQRRFSQQPELLGAEVVLWEMLTTLRSTCWGGGQPDAGAGMDSGVSVPLGAQSHQASTEHPAQLDVLAAALGSAAAPSSRQSPQGASFHIGTLRYLRIKHGCRSAVEAPGCLYPKHIPVSRQPWVELMPSLAAAKHSRQAGRRSYNGMLSWVFM